MQTETTIACQPDGTAVFQSWDYRCIDLGSCFNQAGGGLNPLASQIYFESNDEFWIDEVTLATSEQIGKYNLGAKLSTVDIKL